MALRQQWLNPASQSASVADPIASLDADGGLLFAQEADPKLRDALSTAVMPDLVYRDPILPSATWATADPLSSFLTGGPRSLAYA